MTLQSNYDFDLLIILSTKISYWHIINRRFYGYLKGVVLPSVMFDQRVAA